MVNAVAACAGRSPQLGVDRFMAVVGRLAVEADPFGNNLVLIDLSKGHYVTDAAGNVTAVTR
jgi:hypothetical protein